MADPNVIVIGADHYNTLWLIRSLGICNIRPDLIIFEKLRKSFVCHSKYVKRSIIVSDEKELLTTLLDNVTSHKQLLLSSSDMVTFVLDSNYEELCNNYILFNIERSKNKMPYWMNKANVLEIAKSLGVNIPQSESISIMKDTIEEMHFEFPCLIKPQTSVKGKKTDFRICQNRKELNCTIESLKNNCNDVLIQRYLNRDFEFVVNGIRYNGQHIIPGVVRKTMVGNKTYKMGMTTIAFSDPNIDNYIDVNCVKKIMDVIGYEGIYSMEFIVSKGIPYLLEVNFRADATLYISTAGGCNLPALLYDLVFRNNTNNLYRAYTKKAFGMAEISYVKELPIKTPWRVIFDLCKIDSFSIFMLKDIKPFIYKLICAV